MKSAKENNSKIIVTGVPKPDAQSESQTKNNQEMEISDIIQTDLLLQVVFFSIFFFWPCFV